MELHEKNIKNEFKASDLQGSVIDHVLLHVVVSSERKLSFPTNFIFYQILQEGKS